MSANRKAGQKMLASVAAHVPPRTIAQERMGPTPEQRRHGNYQLGDVIDKAENGVAIKVGKAYRREPLFETLAKDSRSGIGGDALRALRYYRARFEETDKSLTRCALDVQGRGGGASAPLPRGVDSQMVVGISANRTLERLDQALGSVVDTMRGVAIEDRSYSELAIARWGSRKQSWIQQPAGKRNGAKAAFVEKIVPKSGRHREIIRQEFLLGLKRLVEAVRIMTSNPAEILRQPLPTAEVVSEKEPRFDRTQAGQAQVDPEFLNEQGLLREWNEIARIIRDRCT
ncbi:hypothetical protein [Sphingomonas sp. OTU376]|uniref:hypothetical protein n=1 Tax=Sphingomonas sp. OTU376 TaxID=3043863 RepID=UPI00313CD265